MHNWRRYPSSNLLKKLTKNVVQNLAVCCGAIWRHKEKPQCRCTTTILLVHNSPKDVLENLLPIWLSVRTTLFIPSRFWTTSTKFDNKLLPALCSDMRKMFLHRCTSMFSALNECSGIFFTPLSYLYEVVRTNFSVDFLDI